MKEEKEIIHKRAFILYKNFKRHERNVRDKSIEARDAFSMLKNRRFHSTENLIKSINIIEKLMKEVFK